MSDDAASESEILPVQQDRATFSTRIASGSIGSLVTSLAVTPLEVVKVRLQSLGQQSAGGADPRLPRNVRPCPKGCGTFVLNNGQLDCVLPKSLVPYFDKNGNLTPKALESARSKDLGTFAMARRIFQQEGYAGIYAGLRPTLAMAVPNTVLYFSSYEEFMIALQRNRSSDANSLLWTPLVAGGSARLVASTATAPFEYLRTRQASVVGGGGSQVGMMAHFKEIISSEGSMAVFKGLRPTLWRDVPFSAIYWFSLEQFRLAWRRNSRSQPSPFEQAGQAFFNGALAGMIAAACTTPFDVLKTRQQQLLVSQYSSLQTPSSSPATSELKACCTHGGAVVYEAPTVRLQTVGTFANLQRIASEEGIAALWVGNQARMLKVAPACAIMLSCYEFGKRILE